MGLADGINAAPRAWITASIVLFPLPYLDLAHNGSRGVGGLGSVWRFFHGYSYCLGAVNAGGLGAGLYVVHGAITSDSFAGKQSFRK